MLLLYHFFTRLLDAMGRYKLNKLHFHLTDDEGWRLEIPGLEELTKVILNYKDLNSTLTCYSSLIMCLISTIIYTTVLKAQSCVRLTCCFRINSLICCIHLFYDLTTKPSFLSSNFLIHISSLLLLTFNK